MFFFFLFGAVRFHTAIFSSEPEIVNKTTRVLRSSINWTEILKQGKAGSSKTGKSWRFFVVQLLLFY